MYIKIVINKQNFLIFQMKKKPTIYQTPTHGLHHFPLQCTHPPTGEEREPPTSQTIVLAIKKTIQGSHPERHLRRNMESTGILKNPQSPRVASLLMSDPSLKCFFFFLWFLQWPKKLDTKILWTFDDTIQFVQIRPGICILCSKFDIFICFETKNWWILISGIVLSPPFTLRLKLNCQPINC